MPCVPYTGVERMGGRVFGREHSGVYAIQLDGFPGVIRVCPLFSDNPVRNFSTENPVPVTATITKYDTTSQVFHGSVMQCSPDNAYVPTNASVHEASEVGSGGGVKPIPRRLRPMVFQTQI